ncbi:general secretion pathway protein D [Natronocella acetinitrilica]|uniref:General secretion pathway protein D n=2 Tax=Natronocella acetinitrilica TaxID=414046 RepID=A0AAE3G1K8_9GAMM|nr:general secretion pathway protein D [Natronocella acetinitrilica]
MGTLKGRRVGALASTCILGLLLTLAAGPIAAQQERVERGQPVTLNLKDADIRALINTVAEVTGRNFIIDPRVRGQVTLISRAPMEPDELYRAFLSVLQVHGFATVPAGEVIKIIPDANAKQLGPDMGTAAASDDIVTTVIQVENVPVAQLVPILRPLLPQQGHLAAYPPTNVLIVSDRSGNVERIAALVQEVDRAGDDEIDIVRLQHASVGEMVRILNSLRRTDAETVPAQQVQIAADERTNSVLLSGDRAQRLRMRALIAQLDDPMEDEGDTHVIYLRYSRAEDLVTVLQGVTESMRERQEEAGQNGDARAISIQAEETTNSLVITAPPAMMQSLRSVIDRLDIRRAQILVEAAIAEISEERGSERGVQWFVDGSDGEGFASLTNFGGVGTSIGSLLTLGSSQPQVDDGLSMVVGDLDSRIRFGAFIRALASDRNTNILSTPSLVTMDNQEAEIRVAENRPFVTGQFTSEGRNVTNPFQTIDREDVGIILKIKPQINEGNAIQLEIEQEASNVIGTTAAGPITNRRTIQTHVLVDDGQVIALGGLMDDDVQEQEQRVPGLGSLPILGELFRYRSTSTTKRNLMVFMQPTIVRDRAIADDFSGRKYNFMRAQQLDRQQQGVSMVSGTRPGVLPSLERAELPRPFDP